MPSEGLVLSPHRTAFPNTHTQLTTVHEENRKCRSCDTDKAKKKRLFRAQRWHWEWPQLPYAGEPGTHCDEQLSSRHPRSENLHPKPQSQQQHGTQQSPFQAPPAGRLGHPFRAHLEESPRLSQSDSRPWFHPAGSQIRSAPYC